MTTYETFLARNEGLGEVFLRRMQDDPHARAVVDGETVLTYEQLHAQAVQLAHRLRQAGAAIEEPVGILVQHGILDAVAQVAVIYSGATCVPLDPELPDQQIQRRLNRLGTRWLLVDTPNRTRGLPFSQLVVETQYTFSPGCPPPTYRVQTGLALGHRTHLIHTSGTTSEPKAVQILARSIVHVAAHAPDNPVTKTDVVAHGNSTSFDISLFDIWAALLQGATIAVLHKDTLLDMDAFAAAIQRYSISAMTITAPLVNLAAAANPRLFAPIRVVLMGGEAVNIQSMRKIFQAGPPEHMVNAYGPTECCAYCLAREITAGDLDEGVVGIGQAIGSNVTAVCDEEGNPVADGEEGELLVGGPCVSPGYVTDPEKNAAAFVHVPGLVDAHGQPHRMYRTGDIVRRRADGQHDFIGRRDHQVKIRGYRMELGAVENTLMETGHFSECIAMGVESTTDGAGSVLVAFTVLAPGCKASAVADATVAMKAALPRYMIPHIQPVDRIPLTSHAKVDRQQLKQWYFQRQLVLPSTSVPCKSHTSTRDQLAILWASILAIQSPTFAAADDFFQLGGSSLQASLLITLIQRIFSTKVSLLALYDHPTLAQLSSLIDAHRGTELSTVRTDNRDLDLWLADTLLADTIPYPASSSSLSPVDWRHATEGRVFLTGATGFVGTFLLSELLQAPYVQQVACLVRAPDPPTAQLRLRRSLAKYHLWRDDYTSKLIAIPGRLEDPHLGLSEPQYTDLAHRASVIFHLGALVNYTQPYAWHRPANVTGTLHVARLAVTGRLKGLHYCSSISCFGPTGSITGVTRVLEDGPLLPHLPALPYDHGYAQSQWVAEEMLRRLRRRGVPVAVYRTGFITGHSVTGACNAEDFFSRLMRACVAMACYPVLPGQRKEFVTVDAVARGMVDIASSVGSLGHAFHLVPGRQEDEDEGEEGGSPDMNSTMEMLGRAAGREMLAVPYEEWVGRLAAADEETRSSLQPLLPMLAEKVKDGRTRWELYEKMPVYDNTNAVRALAGGVKFPAMDEELMRRYLHYLGIC
ncbi:hypothetical protein BJX61DRAFT_552878 [Aspergillus egyptiacus]|nr:hypothetical protein BJX61DRAFT_552878 [Aspergillus egyptiacus]